MKRFLCLLFLVLLLFNLYVDAFAYRWKEINNEWYAMDDEVDICLPNKLIDDNGRVYCTDEYGKILLGWYYNNNNQNAYFFDNNRNADTCGQMAFGMKMIDGYLRYFADNGALVRAEEQGQYRQVSTADEYKDYYADYDGNLYYNNALQRDVSKSRSDYYTDIRYYEYDALSNRNLRGVNVITWKNYKEKMEYNEKVEKENIIVAPR